MANHPLPGEREVLSEPPESSWRPEDPDLADERPRAADRDPTGGGGELRDARRWDSDEELELDAAAYDRAAGHHGEAGLRELERGPRRDDGRPSAGSFEDRHHELGAEAGIGAWPDLTGDPWRDATRDVYRGRDFEPERHELSAIYGQRTGYAGLPRWRGDERIGEPAGSYSRPGEVHVPRGTGPHRGKGPKGYQRSDERIRELVCESLTDDDQIDASHIEVGVADGEVTLSGTVDDRGTKRAAEDCAYAVSGVRDVQNRLRVRGDRMSSSNLSGSGAVSLHETQYSTPGGKPRA